ADTFPGLFAGYTMTVRESHQKGKADISGTARKSVTLQTHCHEYAVFGVRTGAKVLESLGVQVHTADGCCGVAGNFGFERGHYEVSVAVSENALAPALRAAPDRPVITDGFSCAMSVDHLADTDAEIDATGIHLAELLTRRTPTATASPPTEPAEAPTEPAFPSTESDPASTDPDNSRGA
ncbi:MAG: hypothetical protein SW127_17930, partial [Actinomycetota bacterium]|nr:hypothetical protein [Actinomycetota bacterium]